MKAIQLFLGTLSFTTGITGMFLLGLGDLTALGVRLAIYLLLACITLCVISFATGVKAND